MSNLEQARISGVGDYEWEVIIRLQVRNWEGG